MRVLLLAAGVAGLATACAPTCAQTCRKVLSCTEGTTVVQAECLESCERNLTFVESEDSDGEVDKELRAAFADHRRCLVGSTCDEIEAGACYDEQLFLLGD